MMQHYPSTANSSIELNTRLAPYDASSEPFFLMSDEVDSIEKEVPLLDSEWIRQNIDYLEESLTHATSLIDPHVLCTQGDIISTRNLVQETLEAFRAVEAVKTAAVSILEMIGDQDFWVNVITAADILRQQQLDETWKQSWSRISSQHVRSIFPLGGVAVMNFKDRQVSSEVQTVQRWQRDRGLSVQAADSLYMEIADEERASLQESVANEASQNAPSTAVESELIDEIVTVTRRLFEEQIGNSLLQLAENMQPLKIYDETEVSYFMRSQNDPSPGPERKSTFIYAKDASKVTRYAGSLLAALQKDIASLRPNLAEGLLSVEGTWSKEDIKAEVNRIFDLLVEESARSASEKLSKVPLERTRVQIEETEPEVAKQFRHPQGLQNGSKPSSLVEFISKNEIPPTLTVSLDDLPWLEDEDTERTVMVQATHGERTVVVIDARTRKTLEAEQKMTGYERSMHHGHTREDIKAKLLTICSATASSIDGRMPRPYAVKNTAKIFPGPIIYDRETYNDALRVYRKQIFTRDMTDAIFKETLESLEVHSVIAFIGACSKAHQTEVITEITGKKRYQLNGVGS